MYLSRVCDASSWPPSKVASVAMAFVFTNWRGIDESQVVPDRPTQSILAEDTFARLIVERLPMRPTGAHDGGDQTFGVNGSADYTISGAGVYLVEFVSTIDTSIRGASSTHIRNRAQISVSAH